MLLRGYIEIQNGFANNPCERDKRQPLLKGHATLGDRPVLVLAIFGQLSHRPNGSTPLLTPQPAQRRSSTPQ